MKHPLSQISECYQLRRQCTVSENPLKIRTKQIIYVQKVENCNGIKQGKNSAACLAQYKFEETASAYLLPNRSLKQKHSTMPVVIAFKELKSRSGSHTSRRWARCPPWLWYKVMLFRSKMSCMVMYTLEYFFLDYHHIKITWKFSQNFKRQCQGPKAG